jgi:hypothetical protein
MLTRYTSGVLLLVVGSLAVSTAFAQSQNPPGASAQASGQGAAAAGRSGASGQGSGSADAAAHAGDRSAQLAGDSSVNAVLTRPVDSRKSKPGDPVSARTTQPSRTDDGRSIPKGSTLVGHVSEARARGDGQTDSAVGIVFDKAVTRDGRQIPLRNVGIRALAAAEGAASGSFANGGMATGAGGMGAGIGAPRGGGGGGLVGRTSGAVGGAVGGGLGAAGGASGATGSLAGSAGAALQGGPGAVGGLGASGLMTAESAGVFGLRDLSLATAGSSATQGSVVTSSGKSVHLDQGTRMLLGTEAGASGQAKPASSKGTEPDKR